MGERFRVEPEALQEFADYASGAAEKAPGARDLSGDPVFGSRNMAGAQALAQAHYTMWRKARQLAGDVQGGLQATGSSVRDAVANYQQADEGGRARMRAVQAALDDWQQHGGQGSGGQGQPQGQGSAGRSPYGQYGSQGSGQQPQPSPSGTGPSGGGPSGDLPADPYGDGINQTPSQPASPQPSPGGSDGGSSSPVSPYQR